MPCHTRSIGTNDDFDLQSPNHGQHDVSTTRTRLTNVIQNAFSDDPSAQMPFDKQDIDAHWTRSALMLDLHKTAASAGTSNHEAEF